MGRSLLGQVLKRYGAPRMSAADSAARHKQFRQAFIDAHPLLDPDRTPNVTDDPLSVAVVGAGFAGLATAYFLQQQGLTVTVFEKENTVGGRVSSLSGTDFMAGRTVEFGAELIGANHILWLQLAQRFGLSMSMISSEDALARELLFPIEQFTVADDQGDGQITVNIDQDLSNQIEKLRDEIIEDANKYIDNVNQPWTASGLPYTTLKAAINDYAKKLKLSRSDEVIAFLSYEYENNNTVAVDDQSYLAILTAIKGQSFGDFDPDKDSEVFRCANGNQELSIRLQNAIEANKKQTEDAVFMAKSVTSIKPCADDATKVNVSWVIENETGTDTYDYVVLAVPTAAYDGDDPINVDPQLLGGKSLSDFKVTHGPAAKLIVPFSERSWITNDLVPSGPLTDDSESNSTSYGLMWETTDQQYAIPGSDEAQFGVSVFAGNHSAQNLMTDQPGCLNAITKKLNLDTTPATYKESDYRQVGYSCPTYQDTDEASTVWKKIYAQNTDGNSRLLLAGEHTSTTFFGFMEGALQSGLRVAELIGSRFRSADGPDAAKTPYSLALLEFGGNVYLSYKGDSHPNLYVQSTENPSNSDSWSNNPYIQGLQTRAETTLVSCEGTLYVFFCKGSDSEDSGPPAYATYDAEKDAWGSANIIPDNGPTSARLPAHSAVAFLRLFAE